MAAGRVWPERCPFLRRGRRGRRRGFIGHRHAIGLAIDATPARDRPIEPIIVSCRAGQVPRPRCEPRVSAAVERERNVWRIVDGRVGHRFGRVVGSEGAWFTAFASNP